MAKRSIKRKVVLLIIDGWGIAKPGPGNYISQANTPNFDFLVKNYPHTQNKAAGNAVGLPEGSQGNSEVGHLHIGAGRIVWQMYERINRAIRDRSFFANKALKEAMEFARKKNSALHLMGLCSDEGVHAHINHLIALLKMARKFRLKDICIHFFADGRDVPERSAKKYVRMIEKVKIGRIASVVGRYYAMDRDKNWGRTKKAYELLTLGKGFIAGSALEAIDMAYSRGDKTDYYIQPTIIADNNKTPTIKSNDAVIFFNFRTDRPRQLTQSFIFKNFTEFERKVWPKTFFVTMTQYDKTFRCSFAFSEENIKNNLGSVLAKKGIRQLRLAETEKYAHVTYFFNSQIEKPYKNEDRIMVPSPKVPSYDLKPEMSAYKVCNEAIKQLKTKKYDFMVVNFANCDLVGHSAVKKAIIKCVEVVDECVGKIANSAIENGYVCIVTADHGSAEDKLYPNGKPKPAHSSNPVPFIIVSNDEELKKAWLRKGGQSDVAPTILDIMGIKKPKEMTGSTLIAK
jgi:2,3-bisphosphoglycerate-independent phosphoglycerate mutase